MPMEDTKVKQQLFEELVTQGFDPLKNLIERKRLEDELTDDDIQKIMDNIGYNCKAWIRWLKHKNQHMFEQGRGGRE